MPSVFHFDEPERQSQSRCLGNMNQIWTSAVLPVIGSKGNLEEEGRVRHRPAQGIHSSEETQHSSSLIIGSPAVRLAERERNQF